MKKLWNEFKSFAFKGNVIDLAVGMMIGAAFTAIVSALVNSIVMPLLSLITGKVDFTQMKWIAGETEIPYGAFLQALFNFAAIALCIFLFVKLISRLTAIKKKEEKEPTVASEPKRLCPYCFSEIHKQATRCPHCTSVLEDSMK